MVRIIIGLALLLKTINCYTQNIDYSVFKGKPLKASISVRIDQPYFCTYKDYAYPAFYLRFKNGYNNNTTVENLILSAYCRSINDLTVVPRYNGANPNSGIRNGLILAHKLTFFWQGVETSIVKFYEMKDSIVGKPLSVQLQNIDNAWKQVDLEGIKYIENALLSIQTNMFWELFNKDESNVPGIIEIRKKVKDDEGILNISLLSNFINQERKKNSKDYKLICDN